MTLTTRLAEALPGAVLAQAAPLHGGDLSEVYRGVLRDGRVVVLKQGSLVAQEAEMLRRLAAAGAKTPEVLGLSGDVMVLTWLPPGVATDSAWADLGASLRRVHLHAGAGYGWSEDYAFGSVAIPNAGLPDWPEFWAARRIAPSIAKMPAPFRPRLEALIHALPDLLPVRPKPGLLHGDLWSGNIHFSDGTGMLIDPACYYGDGEVDLAMLDLFAHLPAPFLEGYGSLAPGYDKRRPIYQIWPALVHVRLFGSGYLSLLDRLLRDIGI